MIFSQAKTKLMNNYLKYLVYSSDRKNIINHISDYHDFVYYLE